MRLYFVIDYNNTQQHTRTTTISPATGRHRRVLSSSHVVYSTHSNHTLCTQHTTHTRTRLIQFKPPLLPAPAPPSRLCSLPALTSLFSLSTGAAEGSGFHSRRASRRARITQHTHRTEAGRRHPQNSTRGAVNTQLQQRRPPPQLISRRTQSPGSRRPGDIS